MYVDAAGCVWVAERRLSTSLRVARPPLRPYTLVAPLPHASPPQRAAKWRAAPPLSPRDRKALARALVVKPGHVFGGVDGAEGGKEETAAALGPSADGVGAMSITSFRS